MNIYEMIKNNKLVKVIFIVIVFFLLASLAYRITYDIAYLTTIKNYSDGTGR